MVTEALLVAQQNEVREALDEVFAFAKAHEKNLNDYIVFLANGTYVKEWVGNINGFSPFGIDYRGNIYDDLDRQKFYVSYLNQYPHLTYEELPEEQKEEFFVFCTTLEMMIYSHVWESTWLLKLLKQLANLSEGKDYDWKIEDSIPDFTRHEFIRNDIRDVFGKNNLSIAALMSKTYNSQIRNAFAHSDYSFGLPGAKEKIFLLNFKPSLNPQKPNWLIREMSFDDWHLRFALTINLAHFLVEKISSERQNLPSSNYEISFPDFKNGDVLTRQFITYTSEHNNFYFTK